MTVLQHSLHIRYVIANFLCGLLPDFFSAIVRARMYRLIGFKIGKKCVIAGNVNLITGKPGFYNKLIIGDNILISTDVTINLDDKVYLEDNVTLGPFVRIYTGSHPIGPSDQRCQPYVETKPVVVEHGSWVAVGAIILPGVRVGRGSIVGAGAVVTKDVPPNTFVVGVPARPIKTLP